MGNNPSEHKGNPRYPVDNINWNDAQKFVEELNKLTDGNFAMPTEAQWEFAARGGVKSESYLYCGSKEPKMSHGSAKTAKPLMRSDSWRRMNLDCMTCPAM